MCLKCQKISACVQLNAKNNCVKLYQCQRMSEEMKSKNHKVILLAVLFVSSAIFLCYCLLNQEPVLSINSQPVSAVTSTSTPSKPSRQNNELPTHEANSTTSRYENKYNVMWTKSNISEPQVVHLKHLPDIENKKILKVWPGGPSLLTERSLLQQRAGVVQHVCRRYNVHQAPPGTNRPPGGDVFDNYVEYVTPRAFYLLRSASTLTCVINKVASSSLVNSLLEADGHPLPLTVSPHRKANDVLQPKTKEEFEFARKHFFKFLIVRHPFRRLLSAYRDKVEAAKHWSLKELRKHIFKTLAETRLTEKTPNSDSQYSGDDIPSFSDFLEYILVTNYTGDGFDSHWAPYWHLCSPCALQYDAVATLETAHTDLKYIWQKMGLHKRVPWINRSSQQTSNGSTIKHYYQDLTPHLIARVYHHYLLDFEMFQYSILDVVKEGGHCQMQDCSDMTSYFS